MSIIYDALKKVGKSDHIALKTNVDKDYKPSSKLKIYLYLLYVLAVCFGGFIANTFFNLLSKPLQNNRNISSLKQTQIKTTKYLNSNQKSPSLEITTPVSLLKSQKAPPTLISKPQPSLVLSGVLFSDNEGYALINNQILKEGDIIEEAKVKQITLEEVVLEFEGKIISLSNIK